MEDFWLPLMLLLLFGPALVFLSVGLNLRSRGKTKASKVFFVLTGVYLLISLGTCGAMLTNIKIH